MGPSTKKQNRSAALKRLSSAKLKRILQKYIDCAEDYADYYPDEDKDALRNAVVEFIRQHMSYNSCVNAMYRVAVGLKLGKVENEFDFDIEPLDENHITDGNYEFSIMYRFRFKYGPYNIPSECSDRFSITVYPAREYMTKPDNQWRKRSMEYTEFGGKAIW